MSETYALERECSSLKSFNILIEQFVRLSIPWKHLSINNSSNT